MRWMVPVAFVLALAACFGGLERNAPEPAVYVLRLPPQAEAGAPLAADLLVLQPATAPELATGRIATRWPGNRVDYYANARWSGELGLVVQSALVESIRTSGRLKSVEADPGRFGATHVLGIDISRFDADYTTAAMPVARVALTATVARFQDRRVLANWTASAEQAATANTLTAVTAALNDAFGQAASDLVARAEAAIAADLATPPGG